LSVSAQDSDEPAPILHEFFLPIVHEPTPEALELPDERSVSLRHPVYASSGATDPGGDRSRSRPGARNAPISAPDDLSLDRDTAQEGWLTYYSVFDPTVVPFKRVGVRDQVIIERGEVRLSVRDADPRLVVLDHSVPSDDTQRFWGSILVAMEPGVAVPIPSVSARIRVHAYETMPELALVFLKDSAANLFVRGDYSGLVRVNYLISAPIAYFGGPISDTVTIADIPQSLRPSVPVEALPAALELLDRLDLSTDMPLAPLIGKLAE
jgi:hypothetical protein